MRFHSSDELSRELVRMRLVTEAQLAEVQAHFPITSDPHTLLKALEQEHILTSYQASKLRSDEKSPVVLGNIKLMYQNASGSFARVFRACQIDSGETIGVKVLRQRYVDDPAAVAHFHREAELCMKLKHKNIVPIYDVGTDDGFHYFTMEFVEGGNLRDFVKIRGKLPPAEVLRYGIDMAEGLEYALSQGMTHRDFKLSNVLMSSTGIAKLVDFGLAGDESTSQDSNVQAVEYSTLEKGSGAPRNDPRSDLYFLGAVLYELAVGIPPYPPSKSIEERKQFSRYAGIRPIRSVNPNIPPRLCEIIDRLLRVRPGERYQSAAELLKDLRAAVAEFGGDTRTQALNAAGKSSTLSTILCVEHRIQQQDMLREYLTKHGFRVLMLSTWDRALARLKTNPPDCLLIIGDALDGNSASIYDEAVRWSGLKGIACLLVLSPRDQAITDQLHLTASIRAMQQPVTLRNIRSTITEAIQARLQRG